MEETINKAEQIVGKLDTNEPEQVLKECIAALPEDRLIAVLSDALTLGQCEEILATFP